MRLDHDAVGRPMKIVYSLRDELRENPQLVAQVQALTLNRQKPDMGLKGAHGLYGSDEWWQSIATGRIKTQVTTGTITELFFAGQDSRWGDEVNSFRMKLEDGSMVEDSIYPTLKSERRLFVVGAVVNVVHAFDKMKQQPRFFGSPNYLKILLEMAISLPSYDA